ncbi:guanine nucleotide-binding protein G(I)/G(S)/G(O) subunit gamma-10 [Carlito syrichta]|uniref:Guanine nucleotide-binding protein subunit gamma n=1 Tax=Carlito syrichta TaxID=1868482 RepID=A0A1U7U1Q8_CARSF|nr:guanine nucleotide-binding protein G(I)/G(S)/G(O) subunit gamma-10 [Carlito syrichta]
MIPELKAFSYNSSLKLEIAFSPPPPSEHSSTAMSSVRALQPVEEQLKLEAGVERIKVSQAVAELQRYCMQNACKDALLVGAPTGSNPFWEPRSRSLL